MKANFRINSNWIKKWQPNPVFLPGKSHGLRSMVGYSRWGHKESDMTERLNWIPLPFINPTCTSGSSQFTYCWSLAWRIFEHYLASMWNEFNCVIVWTFFGIALLWDWNAILKDDFQSCSHCWVFQICWHVEWSTLAAASYFRIWNSSAGIPWPWLALFIVMLPKVHLISDSRMSGSRWVITLSWFFWSLRSICIFYNIILYVYIV